MRKIIFLIFTLIFFSAANAQSGDFIVVKKKNRTIATYFPGYNIQFLATNGAYRDAKINKIENDTLYLQEFVVYRVPTTYGGFILDTAGSFRYKYHYNQIHSFGPPKQKGFSLSGSGASLMGGGLLLMLGSGVVYVADREKFSSNLLIGGAALSGLGYILSKAGSKPVVMGKRNYHVVYMGGNKKD